MKRKRRITNCFPRERCVRCCQECPRPYVIPALRGKKPKFPVRGGASLTPSPIAPRETVAMAR